jgi:hypothetical protein
MSQSRVLVIDAAASSTGASIAEAWSARELMYFLVWRDLKVRYKQTALGALWALIQPFATMVVFSLFFGRLVGVPSDGVPYPIFAFAALVPWTYFSTALGGGAQSLVGSQGLISKVYFPRLVIPIASIATPLVDGGIAMAMLFVLMGWYGILPPSAVAAVCRSGHRRRRGGGGVALGPRRALPRRPLRDPVSHPVLAVRDAGGLSDHAAPRALAAGLRPESDGDGG